MTSEKWEFIKDVFEAALDQSPDERANFVRVACKGDRELESAINDLLSADQHSDSFLDRGLFDRTESLVKIQTSRTFSSGDLVSGRFEILRFLGEGGMGEV